MKDFFKSVRKHIDRLDAGRLREQYKLVADELASLDKIIDTMNRGIIVVDDDGTVTRSNPAAHKFLGVDPAEALPQLGSFEAGSMPDFSGFGGGSGGGGRSGGNGGGFPGGGGF